MRVRLYVRNLHPLVNDLNLEKIFISYGVDNARVVTQRDTGRSRGFGFVEIVVENIDDVQKVVDATNGLEIEGRRIAVRTVEEEEFRKLTGSESPGGRR